ncbi:MAG: hypothetical protein GTO17_09760 [Candidatus Aminicenantes bacterium]|nr:hypothetical protein [Candidatus Aminicenantes bacterium]
METKCFDALVDFSAVDHKKILDVFLRVKTEGTSAAVQFYGKAEKGDLFFVRVCASRILHLKWKDKFEIKKKREGTLWGKGIVLNPVSSEVRGKKAAKRMSFLELLRGDKKEMLAALAQERGIQGLREREVINFCRFTKSSLRRACQELEQEGKVRILSFSPLFLVDQPSLVFLSEKIVSYLEQYHQKHPEHSGVSKEKIKKRYDLHPRILSLSLKILEKKGLVEQRGDELALAKFQRAPTAAEENILQELEKMCFQGEFRSVSMKNLQQRFRLSSKRLNMLLALLIEREKIVQSKDGFFLHSRWLEEIISKLKEHSGKELTVSDFKKITGLSRKYAIPLLELLDQMGVTRRISPSRRVIG